MSLIVWSKGFSVKLKGYKPSSDVESVRCMNLISELFKPMKSSKDFSLLKKKKNLMIFTLGDSDAANEVKFYTDAHLLLLKIVTIF